MKRFIVGWLILSFFSVDAQFKWDGGGGDGQWLNPLNWVGDLPPSSSDNVLIDNSSVNGNYNIYLPAGNLTITLNSLVLTPAPGRMITLILPATNTADPGLVVTGNSEALIINQGGVIRNSSGASTGSGISITNFIRINNGGRYIHNTTRGNAAIVSQLATGAGTELGEFEYDVPSVSTTISISGRNYGVLILSAIANGGMATYIGTGISPLNVYGNLIINTGVTFGISLSANFIIHGSLFQNANSIFNIQNSSNSNVIELRGNLNNSGLITETGTGLPRLELKGSSNQQILLSGGGNIANSIELVINNPMGVTLNSAVTLPFHLHLINGKIFTSSINLLTLIDGALCNGGSMNSFIDGPVKKIGDDPFIFKVGEGNIYAPVSVSNGSGENQMDAFIAEYKRESPQFITGPYFQNPIDHVSFVEYWLLGRVQGSSSKLVGLNVSPLSFATQSSSLLVARWDGVVWRSEGQSGFIPGPSYPPYITGELLSSVVTDFNTGIFTIGSSIPDPENPLPLRFIKLEAVQTQDRAVLDWEVAEVPPGQTIFEIEYSIDALHFIQIGIIQSVRNTRYHFVHSSPEPGMKYYRVVLKNPNGETYYSPIAILKDPYKEDGGLHLFPNPVSTVLKIWFAENLATSPEFLITDISGRILKRKYFITPLDGGQIDWNISDLPAGTYVFSYWNCKGKLYSKKFIKR